MAGRSPSSAIFATPFAACSAMIKALEQMHWRGLSGLSDWDMHAARRLPPTCAVTLPPGPCIPRFPVCQAYSTLTSKPHLSFVVRG